MCEQTIYMSRLMKLQMISKHCSTFDLTFKEDLHFYDFMASVYIDELLRSVIEQKTLIDTCANARKKHGETK